MIGLNAQDWQPRLHALIARQLTDAGWSQAEVAETLGTTQSSVSRWVRRDSKPLERAEDEAAIIELCEALTADLVNHGPPSEAVTLTLRIEHADGIFEHGVQLTTSPLEADAAAKARLITDMVSLVHALPITPPHLRPGVGVNLAACVADADSQEEVAAFPGRLRIESGRLVHDAPPRFGVSRHLARVLMEVRARDATATCIVNLRAPTTEIVRDFGRANALSVALAPKAEISEAADLLLDEGDFGWEPNLYITGPDLATLRLRLNTLLRDLADGTN